MNQKKYKNSNGAISVFVLMSMLFFLFAMIGVFSIMSKRAQTQSEALDDLNNKYTVINSVVNSVISRTNS